MFPLLIMLAGCIAALFALGLVLMGGLLVTAALLPRGHPLADRLRSVAGAIPGWALRSALATEGLLLVGVFAFFAYAVIRFG